MWYKNIDTNTFFRPGDLQSQSSSHLRTVASRLSRTHPSLPRLCWKPKPRAGKFASISLLFMSPELEARLRPPAFLLPPSHTSPLKLQLWSMPLWRNVLLSLEQNLSIFLIHKWQQQYFIQIIVDGIKEWLSCRGDEEAGWLEATLVRSSFCWRRPTPPSYTSDRIWPTHKSRLAVQVKDADDGSSQNRGISSDKTDQAEGRVEKSCISEVDNCLNTVSTVTTVSTVSTLSPPPVKTFPLRPTLSSGRLSQASLEISIFMPVNIILSGNNDAPQWCFTVTKGKLSPWKIVPKLVEW